MKYSRAALCICFRRGGVILTLLLSSCQERTTPSPAPLRIAVAANFQNVAKQLARAFENKSQQKVEISVGSSGKLYAQIVNGAPYDVFLSADAERPRRLEEEGHARRRSRFTYALGQLALFCGKKSQGTCRELRASAGGEGKAARRTKWRGQLETLSRVALAESRVAPYGDAAQQTLLTLDLWHQNQDKWIVGENVAQIYSFVDTGNVPAALVALAQVQAQEASFALIPPEYYSSIQQQAVAFKESVAVDSFLRFLREDPEARALILGGGYLLPKIAVESGL